MKRVPLLFQALSVSVISVGGLVSSVEAATVTYHMAGTVGAINVNNTFPSSLGSIVQGGSFTASFTLDLSASPSFSITDAAGYQETVPSFAFSLTTGGLTVSLPVGATPSLSIATPPTYTPDEFNIATGSGLTLSSGWSSTNSPYASFIFEAISGTPISSTALAQLPTLDLAQFNTSALNLFTLSFGTSAPTVNFPGGSVSSPTSIMLFFTPTSLIAVPEPASIVLFGLGAGGLFWAARRRQRRTV